jgi:ornithine cyclodeaminase/alanine dehydrogenase-like protein (mu-crystallin family)
MALILSNADVAMALSPERCLEVMERAYLEQAASRAVNRPTTHSYLPGPLPSSTYSFKSVDGGVASLGVLALRLTSDVLQEQHAGGLVRLEKLPLASGGRFVGLVQLFSVTTGALLAIMPDGVIQQTRVAATSALGTRAMARGDSRIVALIGSGGQARAHYRYLAAAMPLERIRVYSPNHDRRGAFAAEMASATGVPAEAVDSAEAAVDGCDIVCTATNSSRPVVDAGWLRRGMHYTAIREFELDHAVFDRSDLTVIHTRFGGIHHYQPPGIDSDMPGVRREKPRDWSRYPEICDVLAGKAPGRTADDQLTLFLNNVGTGVQFAAIGYAAYEAATARGLGHSVPDDWFLQDIKP